MRAAGTILVGLLAGTVCGLAQTQSMVIRGKPFAAIASVRRVRVLPDGKEQFVRNESYPKLLARDAAGRIRMDVVPVPDVHCDTPTEPNPLPCSLATVILFDPAAQTITHWPEGEMAGHAAVRIRLTSAQVEEAGRTTTAIPSDPRIPAGDENSARVESLGEKTIEGVPASGVRVTRVISATSPDGRVVRRTDIHEVWTSAEMHLVLRVVDGDPKGEETVRELRHVSLSPDSSLFDPPQDYSVQTRDHEGDSRFAAEDVEFLRRWFLISSE